MRILLAIFLLSPAAWALSVPKPPPTPVAPNGLAVLHLNTSPLLRSEVRALDRLAKQLAKAGRPVVVAPADRHTELLTRYFELHDPAERAKLDLGAVVRGEGAVLVIRYAPPRDSVAQRPLGVALLRPAAPHEVFWISGMGLSEEGVGELVKLIKGVWEATVLPDGPAK
jgi:hypothetical protein